MNVVSTRKNERRKYHKRSVRKIEIKMKEKENIQETIQHLGELCYDNGITENDIWNFIRDKKSKED